MNNQATAIDDDVATHNLFPVEVKPRGLLRSILWSTDFSAPSEISLSFAAALTRRFGSRLYAAQVISPHAECFGPGMPLLRLGLAEQMAFRKMSELLGDAPHEKIVGLGKSSRVLANMVQDFDIDLLILGMRRRKGVVSKILGSIVEETIRLSPCPVLSVGARTERAGGDERGFKHILCAIDFSLESIAAVRLAVAWAHEHSARLALLHVVEGCVADTVEERGRLAAVFEKQLRRVIPARAMEFPGLELRIEFGSAADWILKAAEQTAADLLVLGTRRVEVLGRRLARRTVAQVLSQARCSVLTVNQATNPV